MDFYKTMQKLGLAKLPNWTVSTLKKEPIDPKSALKNHFNPKTYHDWLKFAQDPDHTLVSLDALYNEPNTPLNSIALHVNIDTQHIMLIDIEHDYDHKVKPILQHLPAIYGELSKHNGIHFIVPIPEKILNKPKYKNLFIKTQVKFGEIDKPHSGVEMFFHNHYLTFTQNQINTKNHNTDQDLEYVLDWLIKTLKPQQIKKHNFIDDSGGIPTDALVIAKHAITDKSDREIASYVKKNTVTDDSLREFKDLIVIAYHLLNSKNSNYALQPFAPDELIDKNSPQDMKMITWALVQLAYDYIPYRGKWHKIVTGNETASQNYIQYSCNKAIDYCMQHPQKEA